MAENDGGGSFDGASAVIYNGTGGASGGGGGEGGEGGEGDEVA